MTSVESRRAGAGRADGGEHRRALALASTGAVLALWWVATDGFAWVDPLLFASPGAVAGRLLELSTEPFAGETLLGHAVASLQRWALGVGVAVGLGVPLGVAMASQKDVDAAATPLMEIVRYIPPLAWVPFAILWFGASVTAQSLVVFVAALPPCVLNSHRGVSQLDPLLLDAARNMGASRFRQVVSVAVPAGLPSILAGVSIATTNGWMALIGAELVGARSGLGFLILRGQANASPETIVGAMVVIGAVGASLSWLLRLGTRRLLRWQVQEASA